MTALIRLIGIGSVIAYGLYKAMQSRTESTQKTWADARTQVKEKLSEQQSLLNQFYFHHQQQRTFHELCNLHYQSHNVANDVYKQLQTPRTLIRELNKSLHEAKIKQQELQQQLNPQLDHITRTHKLQEIKHLKDLRRCLFEHRDALQQEIDTLQQQLHTLNADTSKLKERIRDTCGSRGQEWYQRLQLRITNRRG